MIQKKRVVLIHWKNNSQNPFEVFSSLKNFCQSYPQFNYNTLSNYLSKEKIPYDNQEIHIVRKNVILKPKSPLLPLEKRSILPVVRKVLLLNENEGEYNLSYWLTKTPKERLSAVTEIISHSLNKSKRIDKSKIGKRKLK
jgi:hypothetical protein